VKKSFSEWGDDLCVMVLYPDPRADRLQRRLEQLQRVEDRLQRLSAWEQRAPAGAIRAFHGMPRGLAELAAPSDGA
jgi:hypothetical protein